jgi:hypothetical protein
MKSRKVQIKEFRIRVPGLTREAGRRLGELVAKQLSDATRNTTARNKSMDQISIRLRSNSRSVDRLASDVTTQIRRRLN